MKKILISLLLGTSLLVTPVYITGCATAPAKVLVTTVNTVDVAMQGWGAWVALGNATAAQETQVKSAYLKYQMSESIAEAALIQSIKTGDQSSWTSASQIMTMQQQALLTLINSFKLQPKGTTP